MKRPRLCDYHMNEAGFMYDMEMYANHLESKLKNHGDIGDVNTRFAVFSKIDDVFEQLSVCTYETKEEAESFGDAMLDTVKYFDTEIVVLNVC